jgi:uncharacterized membrane protein
VQQAESQSHLEHWVGRTLLAGLIASGLLLVPGLVIVLVTAAPRPEGAPPALGELLRRGLAGDGVALLDLGLLTLMGTPVLRVAVLAVGWWWEGDRRFASVALAVLALLCFSFAIGFG